MQPTPSKVDKLTQELVEKIRTLFVTYGNKATKAMGETHRAGIIPYLREIEPSTFRPDARVVILKTNETANDNQGAASEISGEVQGEPGGEKPSEASTTTG